MIFENEFQCNFNSFVFSLTTANETFEEKCEDLRRQIDELNREVEIERRKNERLQLEQRTKYDELAAVSASTHPGSRESNVSINNRNSIFTFTHKFCALIFLCTHDQPQMFYHKSNKHGILIPGEIFLQSNKNMSNTAHQMTEPISITMNNSEASMGIDEVDQRLADTCDNEEIMNIITELDGTKRQLNAERQRVSELEDQLSSLSKFGNKFRKKDTFLI